VRDFLERWFYRLVGLAFLIVAVFVVYLAGSEIYRRTGMDLRLDERLPWFLHAGGRYTVFWVWVVALATASIAGFLRLRRAVRERRTIRPAADLSDGPLTYVLTGPTEADVDRLLAAADLPAQDPLVLIGDARPIAYLKQSRPPVSARVDPADQPPADFSSWDAVPNLRGIFVAVPIDSILAPPRTAVAELVRSLVERIRRGTEIDVPIYLVLTSMEPYPGFLELAAVRGPQAEWGATLDRSVQRDPDEPARSLAQFAGRIRRRVLRQLRKQTDDRLANARLVNLASELLLLRAPITEFCRVAFPDTSHDDDRPYLRGVYLAATGPTPEQRACAAYPLRLRIRFDEGEAAWSRQALERDHLQRRRAWRLAAIGSAVLGAVWLYILVGLDSLGRLGWGLAGALAVGWLVALVLMSRRWPASLATPAASVEARNPQPGLAQP
jgi:hypothetical protein